MVRVLREAFGPYCSPENLFVEKARQVRRDTKTQGPSFNPYTYAEKLGIQVEEKENMALDGFLTSDSGQFKIVLKKKAKQQRKNFTLAHEIAHTFFYDLLTHPAYVATNGDFDPAEERLCDIAASELLMPHSMFKHDLLSNGKVTPQTLFWLVGRYNVSLQAVAHRVNTVAQELACVIWRKELDGAINVEYATPWYMRRAELCQTNKSSVELSLRTPGQLCTARDSYYGIKVRGLIRRPTTTLALSDNRAMSVISIGKPKAIKN